MKTPEGKVKDKVKALLKKHGAYQFWPVQTGYGASTLDCLACHYGRWIGIETKARFGMSLTARQKFVAKDITAAGGAVVLVSCDEELAQLERTLEDIERVYTKVLSG